MIASGNASALDLTTLRELDRLTAEYPIEVKEASASPKQLAFQRAFFERKDPKDGRRVDVLVAMGGNRSGKTILAGWLCFAKHLRDHARDGSWYWCVGQTLDRSIGGQQKELWHALPRRMFGAVGRTQSTHAWRHQGQRWDEKIGFGMHRKVVLPTRDGGKCLVEFRSADQDASTFEQAKLDGVWVDERMAESIYDRLLPRVVDKNGFILYSDIPEQWWQFERLKEARPEAGIYFQHLTMHDNAANLPPGAIERASGRMTDDERRLRIAGEFVAMEGVVYREYVDQIKPAGHLVRPFAIPVEWPKYRLIDYGGSAPTACLWVTVAPDESVYVYREHYDRGHGVDYNAKLIIAASGDERYVLTYMDPHAVDTPPAYYGSSPSIADQYAAAGILSTGWPFVNVMGEHALVQRVKLRLDHRKLFVFDTCVNTRREFRSWKYVVDSDGKPKARDVFENDNNHTLDCLKGFMGTNPCFAVGRIIVYSGGQAINAAEDE